jgi:hypothetical protein
VPGGGAEDAAMSPPGTAAGRTQWPSPADAETVVRALRCLRWSDRLSPPDISFVHAMAAVSMERAPTTEQARRLADVAQRIGAEP